MLLFTISFGGLLLMMGHQSRSEALFYYFRLEDQVPENHLLRLIDRHVNEPLDVNRVIEIVEGQGTIVGDYKRNRERIRRIVECFGLQTPFSSQVRRLDPPSIRSMHCDKHSDAPQHFSFTITFGRDGRVKDVTDVWGWD
jgi:hypothetical protein